ncbi:MAG: hypothetical protein ACKO1T_08670 [Sediminibacterium sp.]
MKRIFYIFLLFSFFSEIPGSKAQFKPIAYNNAGSNYAQDFDSLPVSGTFALQGRGPHHFQSIPFSPPRLNGWFFLQYAGTGSQANFYIGSGTSTTHGVISTGTTNQNDRSLGSLSTSGGSYALGVIFINSTSLVLNTIDVGATIEQWRKGGSGKKNNWLLKIKTGTWQGIDTSGSIFYPSGNFSSLHSSTGATILNGNLVENQQKLSFRLDGLVWKPGEQLMLCWYDPDEAGNDDVCSLDGFTMKAVRQLRLPWIDSLKLESISPFSVTLQSRVNPQGSNTQVEWEYDTIPGFDYPLPMKSLPSEINDRADTTPVTGMMNDLIPGKKYFTRLVASNEAGSVMSNALNFVTPDIPPDIKIIQCSVISKSQAMITCVIDNKNSSPIKNTGLQWSLDHDFKNINWVHAESFYTDTVRLLISPFPPSSKIYVRGVLQQNGKQIVGKLEIFNMPIIVNQFLLKSATNSADSVIFFELSLSAIPQNLTPSNFTLISEGVTGARISALQYSGNAILIAVHTGNGDGRIGLQLSSPPINSTIFGLPLIAAGTTFIDKSPPVIKNISFPNRSYKIGDTVEIETLIERDTGWVQLIFGTWAGIPFSQWRKKNDSTYVSPLILSKGNVEIGALEEVSIRLMLSDKLGNRTDWEEIKIEQHLDWIDTKPPTVAQFSGTSPGTYAIGDTIQWELKFSENIELTFAERKPYLWITIGGVNRQAALKEWNNSKLLFDYVIKPGDTDNKGITWKNNITLNGSKICDLAGNQAELNFAGNTPMIIVDGIVPTLKKITFPPATLYQNEQELIFKLDFSEPIKLLGTTDSVLLLVQTEPRQVAASFREVSDTSIQFSYRIQPGDWDKKGVIPLKILLGTKNQLIDRAGNKALLICERIIGSGVFIDATAPTFIHPKDTTVVFCASDTTIDLSRFAHWKDDEPMEKITLQKIIFPGNFIHYQSQDSFLSGGGIIQPNIRFKRNPTSLKGNDTLILTLSDSIHHQSKKIFIEYTPIIENNFIFPLAIRCSALSPVTIMASVPQGGNEKFIYQWETSTSPNTPFKKAGNNDTVANYLPPLLSDSVYFRRTIQSGTCTNRSIAILLPMMGKGLWLGKKSDDWRQNENWCGELVPNQEIDVVITGGVPFSPTITSNFFCRNLEIKDSGVLKIQANLVLWGNVHGNAESIFGEEGTLTMMGKSKQVLSGKVFKKYQLGELMVRNESGLEIKDSLKITRQIRLQAGTISIKDKLRLGKNAMIGPSADGSTIRGTVEANYSILVTRRQYLFTAHPFTHPVALEQLSSFVDITGDRSIDSSFTATPLQFPSAFKLSSCYDDSCEETINWVPFTSLKGKGINSWQPLEGIRWLFRGKKGQGLNDETGWLSSEIFSTTEKLDIEMRGEVNSGDQTIYFPDSSAGFRLLGNPFISPINPMAFQFSDSIAPVYWKWNPELGFAGGFTCHNLYGFDTIPAFGSFLVYLNGKKNKHQITIPEKCKLSAIGTYQVNAESEPSPSLLIEWWKDSLMLDQVMIQQNKKANSDYDEWDGLKIMNPSHNLFSATYTGKRLSYDQRFFDSKTKIFLGIKDARPGIYQLSIKKRNWREEYGWHLHDQLAGNWWPLIRDTMITFQIGSDSINQIADRFIIGSPKLPGYAKNNLVIQHLTIWPVPTKEVINAKAMWWPEGQIQLFLSNQNGQIMKSFQMTAPGKKGIEINVSDFPPGMYQLLITNREQNFKAVGRWIKQ